MIYRGDEGMRRFLAGDRENSIDRLVRLAQDHLEMGVVYITEFIDGRQVFRAVAGDASSFGVREGAGHGLDGSYCGLMVRGEIPNVIPDARADARVRGLPTTEALGIGAYIGVPIYLPGGQLYGTFCALSHHASNDLNTRDGKFMAMLADLLRDELAAERTLQDERAAVQRLIRDGDFHIALQPVVSLVDGRVLSMEALSRFPTLAKPPDVVFEQAERAGLSLELETAAVAKAVELLPSLGADQALAVNLTPDIAVQLMPQTEAERPLDQLILEVTEHAAVADYSHLREQVRPLRDRGLRLAIDDAGAGFASLRHIIELQPDIIKIDRALIGDIDGDASRRSAVSTFVLLALDIGALVVAEGVETRSELVTIAALGVDAAQGYLLARPSADTGGSRTGRAAHRCCTVSSSWL